MVDEYDASINKALGNLDFVSTLQVPEGYQSPLKRMENIYAEFFSKVKMACDKNVARCFLTGVTPLALNEFTSGFNIGVHLSNDLRFASMYGFTEEDVRKGLAILSLKQDVIDLILKSWKRDHNGYYFHPEQRVALYNPTRILHCLSSLERTIPAYPTLDVLPTEDIAQHLLNRIHPDTNSMPAKSTLELMKSNPNAISVVSDVLSSDESMIACDGCPI
jgi:hypothetical protein